ncbi:hypothetical protein F5Y18DRAFT_275016 [Xylariaceae sp. FL1019]|nr:hypothetical protein F5Y18DRAFT_275016 [Xylariaceae sp. FL1019]
MTAHCWARFHRLPLCLCVGPSPRHWPRCSGDAARFANRSALPHTRLQRAQCILMRYLEASIACENHDTQARQLPQASPEVPREVELNVRLGGRETGQLIQHKQHDTQAGPPTANASRSSNHYYLLHDCSFMQGHGSPTSRLKTFPKRSFLKRRLRLVQ